MLAIRTEADHDLKRETDMSIIVIKVNLVLGLTTPISMKRIEDIIVDPFPNRLIGQSVAHHRKGLEAGIQQAVDIATHAAVNIGKETIISNFFTKE